MEVYVIRHTRVNTPKGVCYGQTDVSLKDSFQEEANLLKARLHSISFDTVYSSPLSRCKLLAEEFANNIIFDDRLKEMNFGSWEMKQWNEIEQNDIQPWFDDFVTVSAPEGENFEEVFQRCKLFIEELRTQQHKRVLIVTHGGIIRSLWCYLLQIPLQNGFKLPVGFDEIFHFNLGKEAKDDFIVLKK